jgi:hypothetical protein
VDIIFIMALFNNIYLERKSINWPSSITYEEMLLNSSAPDCDAVAFPGFEGFFPARGKFCQSLGGLSPGMVH